MSESEMLAQTRGLIRETMVDPSAWPHVLQAVADLTGSDGAWLVRETDRTPDAPHTASLDGLLQDYFGNGWNERDENVALCVPRFRRGQRIVSDTDIAMEIDQRRSAFHQDFALKHDLPHLMATSFHAGSTLWGISCLRHGRSGAFDPRQKLVMADLIADLTDAATVSSLLGRNATTSTIRMLDLDGRPACALDATGAVVCANDAFTTAMASYGGDLAVTAFGSLSVRDRKSDAAVKAAIAAGLWAGTAGRHEVRGVAVKRRDGLPIVLKVVPFGAIGQNALTDAKLLLVFPETESSSPLTAERIREVLHVTLAEGRLLLRLRMGDTVKTAAATLGVQRETARGQLKSVYGKLDVHSQRELLEILRRI